MAVHDRRQSAAGWRWLVAALAAAGFCGLVGCGGGSSQGDAADRPLPSDAVATVDGVPITKADLRVGERFETVKASRWVARLRRSKSKLPTIVGYTAPVSECVAQVRRALPRARARKLTDSQLTEHCESTAARIREQALAALLSVRVATVEAADRSLTVTDADADRHERAIYAEFGGDRNLAAYTERTGLTPALLRARAEETALGRKLRAAIARERGKVTDADVRKEFERQDAYRKAGYEAAEPVIRKALAIRKPQRAWTEWRAEIARRWRPKIECRTGYDLVELCGNRKPTTTSTTAPAPSS